MQMEVSFKQTPVTYCTFSIAKTLHYFVAITMMSARNVYENYISNLSENFGDTGDGATKAPFQYSFCCDKCLYQKNFHVVNALLLLIFQVK